MFKNTRCSSVGPQFTSNTCNSASQAPAHTIILRKTQMHIKFFGNYFRVKCKDCLKFNAVRTRAPMMSVKVVSKELQLYFSYLLCEDGYMVYSKHLVCSV